MNRTAEKEYPYEVRWIFDDKEVFRASELALANLLFLLNAPAMSRDDKYLRQHSKLVFNKIDQTVLFLEIGFGSLTDGNENKARLQASMASMMTLVAASLEKKGWEELDLGEQSENYAAATAIRILRSYAESLRNPS